MKAAFELRIGDGLAVLTFDLPGRSVNVFNREVMEELAAHVQDLAGRQDLRCLVLRSGKPRNFIAGADIEAIARVSDAAEAEEAAREGQALFTAWEALPFPKIAAVRGACVGGGCEIALASDYILLSDRPDVRIGLPEIRLGIVPGWGGCTRLPRKIGIAAALDVILGGKTLRPRKAFKLGLADALLPDASFAAEVSKFAARLTAGKPPQRRRRANLRTAALEKNPLGRSLVFDRARKQVLEKTGGHYPAPLRAIEVVRAGIQRGPDAGFAAEARAIGELAVSPTSRNLVHLFRLMEAAKGEDGAEAVAAIDSTAVLGAGVMGGGIAQIIADKSDLPVRMKDIGLEQLASGMAHAQRLFHRQVKRRWISEAEAARKMGLIRPSLDFSGFAGVDLVVEAVVENLEVKREVFAELEKRTSETTILATNTSSISIDLISEGARHPERIIGMHFFNPVDRMPLVELIRGSATSDATVAATAAYARELGKTPVVVGDGPGFLVNRLLGFTLAEAMWLLDEGHAIEDLDRAVADWGMPMGPLTLTDEVGIDVAVKVGHILGDAFPDRLEFPRWFDRLPEDGRLGSKAGKGFYLYEAGRRRKPDPAIYDIIGSRPGAGGTDTGGFADRILLPMLNEAARCLAEGVVSSPGELDLAMIMGTGFPPFRGGPCRWADQQGLASLVEEMEHLAARVGERFLPSEPLGEAAEAGGFYARFAS